MLSRFLGRYKQHDLTLDLTFQVYTRYHQDIIILRVIQILCVAVQKECPVEKGWKWVGVGAKKTKEFSGML